MSEGSFLEGPDGALWCVRLGEGAPVSVWVHGLTGTTEDLRPLAAQTAGTRVLMDLRGHGRSASPPPSAGYDHPALRRDVEAVVRATGATNAVGISTGAGAIVNLIAHAPDLLERAVLLLPASIDGPNAGDTGQHAAMADALASMSLREFADAQADADVPLFRSRPYLREIVRARTLRMGAPGLPHALRAYASGRPPVADASLLTRVGTEVLVLAHEGDPLHDAEHAHRLAGLLPRATLRMWPEPLAMYDDVDALAASIGEFLNP